jgi:hypothetical protein
MTVPSASPDSPHSWRKKPVVIQAFQMTEARRLSNVDWPEWLNAAWNREAGEEGALYIDERDPQRLALMIGTLESPHEVTWNDWIVQGVKGELYPVKPDIFLALHERAGSSSGGPAPSTWPLEAHVQPTPPLEGTLGEPAPSSPSRPVTDSVSRPDLPPLPLPVEEALDNFEGAVRNNERTSGYVAHPDLEKVRDERDRAIREALAAARRETLEEAAKEAEESAAGERYGAMLVTGKDRRQGLDREGVLQRFARRLRTRASQETTP